MTKTNRTTYELESISFSYSPEIEALKGVSFSIEKGERVAILGSNGSGKSTLLMILCGLKHPTRGRISAFGAVLNEQSLSLESFSRDFRKRVCLVFQDPEVQLFSPTVYEEIAFGPLQLGYDEAEIKRRVDDLLALMGLEKLATRSTFSLSGGEKKKVAIASVLAVNPEVILFDEPTNDLDPNMQVWFVELLEGLRQSGKTLIASTHDLGIASEISDRLIVLGPDHQVIADGATEEVLYDEQMLLKANVIHQHAHRHGAISHLHPHVHPHTH